MVRPGRREPNVIVATPARPDVSIHSQQMGCFRLRHGYRGQVVAGISAV